MIYSDQTTPSNQHEIVTNSTNKLHGFASQPVYGRRHVTYAYYTAHHNQYVVVYYR